MGNPNLRRIFEPGSKEPGSFFAEMFTDKSQFERPLLLSVAIAKGATLSILRPLARMAKAKPRF